MEFYLRNENEEQQAGAKYENDTGQTAWEGENIDIRCNEYKMNS